MNELLQDFLSDTSEALAGLAAPLQRLAQDPGDQRLAARLRAPLHAAAASADLLDLPGLRALAAGGSALLAGLGASAADPDAYLRLIASIVAKLQDSLAYIAAFGVEPPGGDSAFGGYASGA